MYKSVKKYGSYSKQKAPLSPGDPRDALQCGPTKVVATDVFACNF